MRFIQLRPPGYSVLHLIHAPRHSSSSACGRLKMLHKGTSIGRSISRPVRYNHIRMHGCHQRPSAYQTIPIVSMRTLSIYDFCWNKAKKGILLYTNCKSALLQPTSGSRRVIQIDWSRWCDWVLLRSVIPQNERKRSCSQKKKKKKSAQLLRTFSTRSSKKQAGSRKEARSSQPIDPMWTIIMQASRARDVLIRGFKNYIAVMRRYLRFCASQSLTTNV